MDGPCVSGSPYGDKGGQELRWRDKQIERGPGKRREGEREAGRVYWFKGPTMPSFRPRTHGRIIEFSRLQTDEERKERQGARIRGGGREGEKASERVTRTEGGSRLNAIYIIRSKGLAAHAVWRRSRLSSAVSEAAAARRRKAKCLPRAKGRRDTRGQGGGCEIAARYVCACTRLASKSNVTSVSRTSFHAAPCRAHKRFLSLSPLFLSLVSPSANERAPICMHRRPYLHSRLSMNDTGTRTRIISRFCRECDFSSFASTLRVAHVRKRYVPK